MTNFIDTHIIKNFSTLESTMERRYALDIVEAGLKSINTESIIEKNVKIQGDILKIKDHTFDLRDFKNIYLIGFGKCASDASIALEKKIGPMIKLGAIIDVKDAKAQNPSIKIFKGTHPQPSLINVKASLSIKRIAQQVKQEDLVLAIVSGGGSALLCSNEKECEAGQKIYKAFLKTNGTIDELNILRKHTSDLKGGGLAKLFYPATIVSLIFSDVPSGKVEQVASGPTFYDETYLSDVEAILNKYNLNYLKDEVEFIETPKEKDYFEHCVYILMCSNVDAVNAMQVKARNLNFKPKIISSTILDSIEEVAKLFTENLNAGEALIGAGEPRVIVDRAKRIGKGGRNCHLALLAANYLIYGGTFISIASDGIDNSDAAGAIVDKDTKKKIATKFNYEEEIANFNSYTVFKEINDLIFTGPTGANVSDLMISLKL